MRKFAASLVLLALLAPRAHAEYTEVPPPRPDVNFIDAVGLISRYGACGGIDDTALVTTWLNAAIAATGVAYNNQATDCKITSKITLQASDPAHSWLTLQQAPNARITFNATTGGIKFDGTGTGGRIQGTTVVGGRMAPYTGQASGSGFALEFNKNDKISVSQVDLQMLDGIAANGILLTEVFQGKVSSSICGGAAKVCVQYQGGTNDLDIVSNQFGGTTHAIWSPSGINSANYIRNNYIEASGTNGDNTTGPTLLESTGGNDEWVTANYHNANFGNAEIQVNGRRVTVGDNKILNSTTISAHIFMNGQSGVVRGNSGTTGGASTGPFILLHVNSVSILVDGNTFIGTPPAGGFIVDNGTTNFAGINVTPAGLQVGFVASGGAANLVHQDSAGGPLTVAP